MGQMETKVREWMEKNVTCQIYNCMSHENSLTMKTQMSLCIQSGQNLCSSLNEE